LLQLKINKELQLPGGFSSLNLEMEFHGGKVTGISGDSGVGKTTVLRMLAGLSEPDNGTILNDGKVWFNKAERQNLIPQKRGLGFVFQDHQLFPNMSVIESLKFAVNGSGKGVDKTNYYLDKFGLSDFVNSMPNSLSGGQKKRVAIAGALLRNPKLLLLDEPFAALDENTAKIIQDEILIYTKENQCITVLVTHEIAEIFKITDYLYTIKKGVIISKGNPSEIFASGVSKNTLSIAGVVVENEVGNNSIKVLVNDQLLDVSRVSDNFQIGEKILVNLGAEKIEILRQK